MSAEISTAPASAVPIDAPRLVTVFCSPPTSPLCSSGTDETVTLPSWDASAPTPRPASRSGPVVTFGPAPSCRRAISRTSPASRATKPARTTRLGDTSGNSLGMPAAARSRVIDRGRTRTPVSMAVQAETDRQEERHAEEQARLEQVLEEEGVEPAAQHRDAQHLGVEQHRLPVVEPSPFPGQEEHEQHAAGQDEPDHRREPEPLGRSGLRGDESPGPGAQDAVDDESEARAPRARCPSGRGGCRASGGVSWIRRTSSEDDRRRRRTSPTNTQRHEA